MCFLLYCLCLFVKFCLFRIVQFAGVFFFFFQAEDGIRDRDVTGVQTCALPILARTSSIFIGTHSSGADNVTSSPVGRSHGIRGVIPRGGTRGRSPSGPNPGRAARRICLTERARLADAPVGSGARPVLTILSEVPLNWNAVRPQGF